MNGTALIICFWRMMRNGHIKISDLYLLLLSCIYYHYYNQCYFTSYNNSTNTITISVYTCMNRLNFALEVYNGINCLLIICLCMHLSLNCSRCFVLCFCLVLFGVALLCFALRCVALHVLLVLCSLVSVVQIIKII